MTRAAIVETLAKEFGASADAIRSVIEMLDAGLTATYIGRFRRAETQLTENAVRRIERQRKALDDLERRRGTILRMLTGADRDGAPADESSFPEIRACMDRFELEDLFLPYRRPEPEVQLALDRGLGELVERLLAPVERPQAAAESSLEPEPPSAHAAPAAVVVDVPLPLDEASVGGPHEHEQEHEHEIGAPTAEGEADEPAAEASPDAGAADEDEPAAGEPPPVEVHGVAAELPGVREKVELTPKLARLCAEFVRPDRGVHTEQEALAGAMRILSDRLGRDPELRKAVRKAMRKHGVLTVRPGGDESQLKRHRALLKLREPIRQLQGRKLIQIRQAQKDRAITTSITLDPETVLPRVRAALGRRIDPDFEGVIHAVSEQAYHRRLYPMVEADVRLELKERGDDEALRFLSQHMRQMLLSPVGGSSPVAGLTINARQDWILVSLGADGEPTSAEIKLETHERDTASIAEALGNALQGSGVRTIAVGHGKSSLAQIPRVRECIRLLGVEADVCIVQEAGLTSYANSELARKDLADFSVPARMAISLGRRFQDLLPELLKVDPRHLGLGMEAGLVSKANLRRALQETIESVIAYIGCDVNLAPVSILRRLPGLDFETASKLVEHRDKKPFESREELRTCGILTEAQWASCVAFLRVPESLEPLDRTALHPEQYPLARRVIESTGSTVSELLGKRGATKGLRRADFDVDETVWRDLIREISFPGRDPRPRFFAPAFLPHDTDPASLQPGQVVEGLVSNLTSFGAFVDLGLSREGLIHISEASSRYVRDAREILSIGQPIRARVLDASGQRIALSLKDVPLPERKRPAGGGGGRRRRERDDRPRPEPTERAAEWSAPERVVRAAQSRRDGLLGNSRKKRFEDGPKGRKGGGGGGRGGGGRGYRGDRSDRDDYDPDALRRAGNSPIAYNPFASFFDAKASAAKKKSSSEEHESR